MMEYLLVIFYTAIFVFVIYKLPFFKSEGLSSKTLSGIFILKILAGITMSLIYTYYYTDRNTADIFKYFDDSKIMYDALYNKPGDFFRMLFGINNNSAYFDTNYYKVMNNWYRVYESNIYNESHTIIRFNALLRIFSFGYYNVHTVVMCFLSLIGLTGIYKSVIKYTQGKSKEMIFGIFLMPSVLFWGSGVLKEGLLFFAIGILLYHFIKIIHNFNFIYFLWIVAGCVLLYYTKFYILAIVIPILISHFWVYKTNEKNILLKYCIVFFAYIIIGFNLHYIFPDYNIIDILVTKQRDFIGLAKFMNSGSYIEIPVLSPDIFSFIKYSPVAFYNTLFRPYFFETGSIFILFAGIENFLILTILFLSIIFFDHKQIHKSFFYASLFAVIFMFVLTGLITPVMGAIVRYKVPALPFLMILLFMMIDKEKLINKIPFLKFLK